MKKTVFNWHRFLPVLLLTGGLTNLTVAQKAPSPAPKSGTNEVNVRIIERTGDDVREIERTYRMDGLSDPERDKLVMKLVDSLKATRRGTSTKRQMTIIVEDTDGDGVVTRERTGPSRRRLPNDAYAQGNRFYRDPRGNRTYQFEFRRDVDSLADRMNRFRFQLPRDFDRQFAWPLENWSRNGNGKPSTIRGLDAYPNNPDRNQLNVRFTAPAKGNVSIIVTNLKGREVARRELTDFSGEFVGQIDLGKKPQGTYFLTVTQNEDGAVKRVVVE